MKSRLGRMALSGMALGARDRHRHCMSNLLCRMSWVCTAANADFAMDLEETCASVHTSLHIYWRNDLLASLQRWERDVSLVPRAFQR